MKKNLAAIRFFQAQFIDSIDGLSLRVFEILFTATFLLWMGHCFVNWREWLTDEGFHLTTKELRFLGYPDALPLLPGWVVPWFGFSILASSAALIFNRFRRLALVGLFACALYAQGVDLMAAFTLNKLFVGMYGILLLSPGYEKDDIKRRWKICAVPLRVIQATLILQYFAAGLAKATHGDWLHGNDVLYTQVQGVYRTDIAALLLRTLPVWAWSVMQHLSLLFELASPLLFTIRWFRPFAFVIGMGFHLMIALLMHDLIFFSVQMWTFYALFVTPDEWRKIGQWTKRWLSKRLESIGTA